MASFISSALRQTPFLLDRDRPHSLADERYPLPVEANASNAPSTSSSDTSDASEASNSVAPTSGFSRVGSFVHSLLFTSSSNVSTDDDVSSNHSRKRRRQDTAAEQAEEQVVDPRLCQLPPLDHNPRPYMDQQRTSAVGSSLMSSFSAANENTTHAQDDSSAGLGTFNITLTPSKQRSYDVQDETLVHCSVDHLEGYTHKFPVDANGSKWDVYVRTRPHMAEFLAAVAKRFEVVLFTASQRIYAEKLMEILDPKPSAVRHRLFREHCMVVEGCYIKDLRILGRNLAKTIIVDNSPQAFAYHLSNGIPIRSWFEDGSDEELMSVLELLNHVADEDLDDVRPFLTDYFQLERRLFEANSS